jgi:hypothetical protein
MNKLFVKIGVGLLSLVPASAFAYIILVQQPKFLTGEIGLGQLFLVQALAAPVWIGLLIGLMIHAGRSGALDLPAKIVWMVSLFLFLPIAGPLYWAYVSFLPSAPSGTAT